MQVVEQAVAVRPEQGHVAGGLQQALLQRLAFLAGFGEAGGVADGAARAFFGEFGDGIEGQFTVGGDEHGVRAARQIGHRTYAGHAFQFVMLRIDQPHLAFEAAFGAALERAGHAAAADEGQVTGSEQALEVVSVHGSDLNAAAAAAVRGK
ncbi:hypothetical protein D3C76_1320460 [compost metagenome]